MSTSRHSSEHTAVPATLTSLEQDGQEIDIDKKRDFLPPEGESHEDDQSSIQEQSGVTRIEALCECPPCALSILLRWYATVLRGRYRLWKRMEDLASLGIARHHCVRLRPKPADYLHLQVTSPDAHEGADEKTCNSQLRLSELMLSSVPSP